MCAGLARQRETLCNQAHLRVACKFDPTIMTAEGQQMMMFEELDVAKMLFSDWEFNGLDKSALDFTR